MKWLIKFWNKFFKKSPAPIAGDFGPDTDDNVPLVRRNINKVIVHCTASNIKKHSDRMYHYLWKWHVEENGWSHIGYHYAINLEGEIIPCRPLSRIGAHCKGQNTGSIGIALHGRYPEDFTRAQFESLRRLLNEIYLDYGLSKNDVYPHNKFSNKACPNFNLEEVINEL